MHRPARSPGRARGLRAAPRPRVRPRRARPRRAGRRGRSPVREGAPGLSEDEPNGAAEEAELASGGPRTVQEALVRARRHARASLAEAVAAVRALLDAAALAT